MNIEIFYINILIIYLYAVYICIFIYTSWTILFKLQLIILIYSPISKLPCELQILYETTIRIVKWERQVMGQ